MSMKSKTPFHLKAASGTPVKAILPTDLYGQAMAMDGLCAIADMYQVPVVMDAAEKRKNRTRER